MRIFPLLTIFFGTVLLNAQTNLWPNPGFENWDKKADLPTGTEWQWTFRDLTLGRNSFAIFEPSGKEAHSGKYSLHLKDNCPERKVSGFGYRIPSPHRYGGKILDFSVWVKQVQAGRPNTVGILAVALSKGKAIHAEAFVPTASPAGWEMLHVRLPLPKDLSGLTLFLLCSNHFGTTAEAFFDDASVQISNPGDPIRGMKEPVVSDSVRTFGSTVRIPQDLPFPWSHEYWGGIESDRKTANRYLLNKKTAPHAGIRFRARRPDRLIDLSAVPPGEVRFLVRMNRDLPFTVTLSSCDHGKSGSYQFRRGVPENGLFRYECTLADFNQTKSPSDLSEIFLQFPAPIEPGVLELKDCSLILPEAKARTGKSERYKHFLEQDGKGNKIYTGAPRNRLLLKKGTFYENGTPIFLMGPIAAYHALNRDFAKHANPLGIQHPAYLKKPDAEIFKAMGFNTYHLSDIPHDLFFTTDFRKERNNTREYSRSVQGIPAVMDMSIGRNPMLDPEKEQRLQQENPDWHAYIPFCPEHPEVKAYYERRCRTEADEALAAGYPILAYELVNESSYNCFCVFNRKAFAQAMRKKYGTLESLNRHWKTDLKTFESAAWLPVRDMPATRNDWCDFASERYVDFLNALKENIRKVDRRPNVYFTEQLALHNVYSARGSGMDYRRIADALDIISHEGGLRFGNTAARQTGNVMEDAACAENRAYLYVSDFYDAVASSRGKSVMNNEYYCARFDFGKRVPSKREDMVSALWSEIFHGSSGALLYLWDKRFWECGTPEKAKNNVINGGYKAYSYLNPYNWPPDQLDFGKQFFKELEPYREKLLENPRKTGASVALFHCYPSMRLEAFGKYSFQQKMFNWHEALLGAQFPLQIVFEEELERGLSPEIQVLVVPEASFVTRPTIPAVERFLKRGGVVVADHAAFGKDVYGESLAGPKGKIIRLNAAQRESGEQLVVKLEELGVRRHGTLLENGKPLRGPDLQRISRDRFQMFFLLNMADTVHRFPTLKLYPRDKKQYYLSDVVRKEILLPEQGEVWEKAGLEQGVPIILPPQERMLLTLTTEKPSGFKTVSRKEILLRGESLKKEDERVAAVQNAERERVRKEREEARIWRNVNPGKCRPLDLSKAVNMAFADEVAGDRKGGWFDQGNLDFSDMPLGNVTAAGVPFHLLDPKKNNRKSAIVLHGSFRPYFPEAVKGIRVDGKVRKIYFLHTVGWGDKPGTEVLTYRIHYEDGTVFDIPVRMKQEINSWGEIEHIPCAKIAVERRNPAKKHLQCFAWENPHPGKAIRTLDILSRKTGAVPAVVGITLEKR